MIGVKELGEELFLANSADKQVKILGVTTTHEVDELRVYVYGVDITRSVVQFKGYLLISILRKSYS